MAFRPNDCNRVRRVDHESAFWHFDVCFRECLKKFTSRKVLSHRVKDIESSCRRQDQVLRRLLVVPAIDCCCVNGYEVPTLRQICRPLRSRLEVRLAQPSRHQHSFRPCTSHRMALCAAKSISFFLRCEEDQAGRCRIQMFGPVWERIFCFGDSFSLRISNEKPRRSGVCVQNGTSSSS